MNEKQELDRVEKAIGNRPDVPSSDDPMVELKRLVSQHKALTMRAKALEASASVKAEKGSVVYAPRKARMDIPARGLKEGDDFPVDLPEDARKAMGVLAIEFRKEATKMESRMLPQLRKIPIYREFLADVFGCGVVVSSYLVTEIDIHRAVKPSQLRRFCGMAVINGRLERRVKGEKSKFSGEMRTRIFQLFSAMFRNSFKSGGTSKYLRIWNDYKVRMSQSARVVKGRVVPVDTFGNEVGRASVKAEGHAHSGGWHKAADVFLTDLYLVWRTLEGLPVWCPYVAEKLGYWHASDTPAWVGGRMLTLAEAKELVGGVGLEVAQAAE